MHDPKTDAARITAIWDSYREGLIAADDALAIVVIVATAYLNANEANLSKAHARGYAVGYRDGLRRMLDAATVEKDRALEQIDRVAGMP